MREVTIQLFQQWLMARKGGFEPRPRVQWREFSSPLGGQIPNRIKDHSMEAIRLSIAKGRDGKND